MAAEEALERLRANQKQAENERAAMLLKEQEARITAESANRAKDRFLAVLSHELRTPLNSMLGWTRVLQEQAHDRATVEHALGVLDRNVRQQLQLINDLLDVSRIVSGKLNVSLAPVELVSVIEMAIDAARGLAEARNISLSSELEPITTKVSGDAERLQQVVSNLLTNALKFTPEGGRVAVRLDRVGTRARVTVADTGSGIPPESLPHVFDRFWQADSSDTRAHGGLGLGLAIVRHLVAAHGGVVRAESAGEGKGATFIVELPTIGAHPGALPPAVSPIESRPRTLPRLDHVRVLVVDDDADTLELFNRVLERQGAVVGTAATVREAVEAADEFDPHVIVSDISMPGADGFELIELIKKRRGKVTDLPFIAVTAYARADARDQILAAGFRRHLAKPVEPADLVTTVAALVSSRLVKNATG
jgi:CheY-like chemotaxis protein